jgi:hypothetical protein
MVAPFPLIAPRRRFEMARRRFEMARRRFDVARRRFDVARRRFDALPFSLDSRSKNLFLRQSAEGIENSVDLRG